VAAAHPAAVRGPGAADLVPADQARRGNPAAGDLDPRRHVRRGERATILPGRRRGSRARDSLVASMWSAAVFEPAFPALSTMAVGSPFPPAPWSAQAVSGWKPKVFFQVGRSRWRRGVLACRAPVHTFRLVRYVDTYRPKGKGASVNIRSFQSATVTS
jgi:hypothetical protein